MLMTIVYVHNILVTIVNVGDMLEYIGDSLVYAGDIMLVTVYYGIILLPYPNSLTLIHWP